MLTTYRSPVVAQIARDGMRTTAVQGRAAVAGRQDPDPDWQPI